MPRNKHIDARGLSPEKALRERAQRAKKAAKLARRRDARERPPEPETMAPGSPAPAPERG